MSVAQQAIKFDIHSIARLNFIFKIRQSNACDLKQCCFGLMAKTETHTHTYLQTHETINLQCNRNLATERLDVCQFDMVRE